MAVTITIIKSNKNLLGRQAGTELSSRKTTPYVQGVSGGIVNILGDGSMDYSE